MSTPAGAARMSATQWVAVALLGGAGALARFGLDRAISARSRSSLPYGTLIVNASGTLLLGTLSGAAVSSDSLLLAGGAAIGSYTTFSTWMLETHRLAEDGELRWAVANVVVSLLLGIAAVALGRAIGRTL
jgi:CrcB protein